MNAGVAMNGPINEQNDGDQQMEIKKGQQEVMDNADQQKEVNDNLDA